MAKLQTLLQRSVFLSPSNIKPAGIAAAILLLVLCTQLMRENRFWLPSLPHHWERHTLCYWEQWMSTKGMPQQSYWARMANHELQNDIRNAVQQIAINSHRIIRVLDAAAGPATILGSVWPGHDLALHACDALAHKYNQLLREYKLDPPIRSVHARLERIHRRYPRNYFDVIYLHNGLGQIVNAESALVALLRILRPGGTLFIGESTRRAAVHSWRIVVNDAGVVLEGATNSLNLTQMLASRANVSNFITKSATVVRITKPG